jgi:hypothetical protein
LISPAVRPALSVLITLAALIGRAASTNPEASAVTTSSRRENSRDGMTLRTSG